MINKQKMSYNTCPTSYLLPTAWNVLIPWQRMSALTLGDSSQEIPRLAKDSSPCMNPLSSPPLASHCPTQLKSLHRLNELLYATSAEFGWAILAINIITLRDLEISTSTTGCGVWWHRAINALIPVESVQKIQVHIISIYTHIALSGE